MPKKSPDVRQVLAAANLPMRMPLWPTFTAWVALDYFHAPGWLWGMTALFFVAAWAIWFHDVSTRRDIALDDLLPPPQQRK